MNTDDVGKTCPDCGRRMQAAGDFRACRYCESVYQVMQDVEGFWICIPVSAYSFADVDAVMNLDGFEVEFDDDTEY